MGWIYRNCLRSLLFLQESESAHNRVIMGLSCASRMPFLSTLTDAIYGAPDLPVQFGGLKFPNPIGLAAGMDKHASAVPMWERLGFGFAELGGVTRHAQGGNEAPRMFRAIADHALVNRMGFNNPGAESVACTLKEWRARDLWPAHPIGINLGKSKITPLKKAAEDYCFTFRELQDLADFFVVNVSSPNTPNLRQLQDKNALDEILKTLREVNSDKALLIKIAPDLTNDALDDVIDLAINHSLAGIVATNTTVQNSSAVAVQFQWKRTPDDLKKVRRATGVGGGAFGSSPRAGRSHRRYTCACAGRPLPSGTFIAASLSHPSKALAAMLAMPFARLISFNPVQF